MEKTMNETELQQEIQRLQAAINKYVTKQFTITHYETLMNHTAEQLKDVRLDRGRLPDGEDVIYDTIMRTLEQNKGFSKMVKRFKEERDKAQKDILCLLDKVGSLMQVENRTFLVGPDGETETDMIVAMAKWINK